MDQSNNSTPDVNNDGMVDSNAAPITNPQPVSATEVEAEPTVAVESSPEQSATSIQPIEAPTQPVAPQEAAPVAGIPNQADVPHKDSHLLLIGLVVATVIVLAIAAYFALSS